MQILIVLQLLVSVTLIILVSLQNKGAGFGRTFGTGPSSFTRRGLEKLVFRATFVLIAVLIVISVLQLVA